MTDQNSSPIELTRLSPGEALRIIFVAQHPNSWLNFHSIWEFARADARFDVKVILAPFIHSAVDTTGCLHEMRSLLLRKGIAFLHASQVRLDELKPHVVFIQNPYEETRPSHLRWETIRSAGARMAYVPYGLELGGGAWNIKAQFDTPVHRNAWKIFVRSERSRDMYGKYCLVGNDHVCVTGHPKFDRPDTETSLPADLAQKAHGRKLVLWTPHFSVGSPPTWSTFELYSSYIFDHFAKHEDLFLILRPHPLLFATLLEREVWKKQDELDFRKFVRESGNIYLHELPAYDDVFSASDALMTDVGSFLLEFLPTEKPILYLHHPDGLGMNDDESLTEVLYQAERREEIVGFLKMVAEGADPMKDDRKKAIPNYLEGLNENIGERIGEHIFASISRAPPYTVRRDLATTEAGLDASEVYWKSSSSTFLAPEEYYAQKEALLRAELSRHGKFDNVLDLGCGSGRFTFLLAEQANSVSAFDISPHLIEAASQQAATLNVNNVVFSVGALDDVQPFQKFSLVSVMGVTSCLIDDLKYFRLLDILPHLCKRDGYLLLVDTLSTGPQKIVEDESGYVAKYRNITTYRNLVETRGFSAITETTIRQDQERGLVNNLFLYRLNRSYSATATGNEFGRSDGGKNG